MKLFKLKVVNEFSWGLIENVINILCKFVLIWFITNKSGFELYGLISYANALLAIGLGLVHLGLPNIITREFVVKPNDVKIIFSNTIVIKLIAAGSAYLVLIGYVLGAGTSELNHYYIAANLLILLLTPLDVITYLLQARAASKYFLQAKILFVLLDFFIKIIILHFEYSILYFALCSVITYVCPFLILCLRKNFQFQRINSVNSKKISEYLKAGFYSYLGGFANTLHMRVDQIMIAELLSLELLGVYSLSVNITEAFYFFAPILIGAMYPVLLNVWEKYDTQRIGILNNVAMLIYVLGLLIMICIIFMAVVLVPKIWDNNSAEIVKSVLILSCGLPFVFMRAFLSKLIVASGMYYLSIQFNFLGLFLNLLLNLFFIPMWGIHGAALSTFLSLPISTFLVLYFNHDCKELKDILKVQYYQMDLRAKNLKIFISEVKAI